MSQVPFPNDYTLRTVADTASKPCFVCHRASSKVLTTADSKDFFYTCITHLSDRNFAIPVIDPKVEAEKKRQEALAKEKEVVIKEYEEKMKQSKWFWQRGEKKDSESKAKTAEEEKDQKLKALDTKSAAEAPAAVVDDTPRQFILHRQFYQMRIDRRLNLEKAKRNQQRLRDPNLFPSTPTGDIV